MERTDRLAMDLSDLRVESFEPTALAASPTEPLRAEKTETCITICGTGGGAGGCVC